MSLVVADQLSKKYISGEIAIDALKDVSFQICPASFISFVGPDVHLYLFQSLFGIFII